MSAVIIVAGLPVEEFDVARLNKVGSVRFDDRDRFGEYLEFIVAHGWYWNSSRRSSGITGRLRPV